MSKYERRMQFEALYAMREGYAKRGDDDRRAVISVEQVISWAEALMATLVPAPSSNGETASSE